MTRRRITAWFAVVMLGGAALTTALVASSHAAPDFDVINGTAVGAADHETAGNDAFPNFSSGAIDNRYPLAMAHVDNIAAEGFGSPADTGPLGQTVAAGAGKPQPQYADAKYPPKAETVTVGSPPGA